MMFIFTDPEAFDAEYEEFTLALAEDEAETHSKLTEDCAGEVEPVIGCW
jgi:hypothetical protein